MIEAVLLVAQDHPDPGLTPERVAAELHVSRRHLDRLLPHGQGIGSLILHFRLRTAWKLLERHPSLPVEVLAQRSGFVDRNTFRENFSRVYGITPSGARAYRSAQRIPPHRIRFAREGGAATVGDERGERA